MKTDSNNTSIDHYIANFPKDTQLLLEQMRAIIKKAAPKATEVISYQMPAFKINGVVVWFAGYARHIGFYPSSSGIAAFKEELSGYKNSKGAVQFPLDKPLPIRLITKIVKYRVAEDLKRAKEKAKKVK